MLRVEIEGVTSRIRPPSPDTVIDWFLSAIVEFLATFFFVFLSCFSIVSSAINAAESPALYDPSRVLVIATSHGLIYSALLFATAATGVSGGYMNPAITLSMMTTRQMSFLKGLLYMISQFVGAILGALTLRLIIPDNFIGANWGNLGVTIIGNNITVLGALLIEFLLSFLLVFVIFCVAISPVGVGDLAPLSVGFTLFVCSLCAVPFTGASLNPARSLGPAIASGKYTHIWIYFSAPFVGALIGKAEREREGRGKERTR